MLKLTLRTNIVSNEELKDIMKETLGFLSATLSKTLGPYGTTTIIQDRALLNHQITKDGYSLLKKIFIDEEEARTILDMVRKISRNLVRKVGDGSTSSIIIANSLFNSITDVMSKHQVPAKDLLAILNDMAEILSERIRSMATPVSDDMSELEIIAAVSTNNDRKYGALIMEIFREVGKHGFVTLEKSRSEKTYFDVTRGFEIPRGWINQLMVNQPDEKTCELHDPYVLMVDDMVREEDLPFIAEVCGDIVARGGQTLAIVAKGFDNAVSTFFHVNLQRNGLQILAVELAMENRKNKDRFNDLAMSMGATPYRKSEGERLEAKDYLEFKARERFGRCNKVKSNEQITRFIEGRGDAEQISERVKVIQDKLEEADRNETVIEMDDEIHHMRKRMASLQNSMAILYVGGASEDAKDSDKYLLEDAVSACRSALNHGYIVGGNLIVPFLLHDEDFVSELVERYSGFTAGAPKQGFAEDVVDSVRTAFKESFICVLRNFYPSYAQCKVIADECVDTGSIYNLKTQDFEKENLSIVNSAETDIEILKSAISIIGLLATSNQFIRVNTK